MKKNENKTKATKESVAKFLNGIEEEQKRRDAKALDKMFREITGLKPRMWGDSMIGYGEYHYKYASGREGDYFRTGFSPRKQNMAVYIMPGVENYENLLKKLGKFKTGKSCLYIKKLEDVNLKVLSQIVTRGWKDMNRLYRDKS